MSNKQFIDNMLNRNYVDAKEQFESMIGTKIVNLIDNVKDDIVREINETF